MKINNSSEMAFEHTRYYYSYTQFLAAIYSHDSEAYYNCSKVRYFYEGDFPLDEFDISGLIEASMRLKFVFKANEKTVEVVYTLRDD